MKNHSICIAYLLFITIAVVNAANAQVQVKDINPGIGNSSPYLFYPLNNKFIFCADDGTHNHQLFVSDGTAAGTTMLTSLPYTNYPFISTLDNNSPPLGGGSAGGGFFYYNGKYYFVVRRNNSAFCTFHSLWQTDGTVSGTVQIDTFPEMASCSNLFVAKNSSGHYNICALLATLPDTGGYYNRLYKYDLSSNTSSTIYVAPNYGGRYLIDQNYCNGANSSVVPSGGIYNPSVGAENSGGITQIGRYPYLFNDKLFVITPNTDSMFSLDIDGNRMFLYQFPFHIYNYSGFGSGTGNHAFVGSKVIIYPDSTGQSIGREPHTFDFSTNTFSLLKDVNPYLSNNSNCSFLQPDYPNSYGKIYFLADDADHGIELWVTDGTTTGTHIVKDISPSTTSTFSGHPFYQYVDNKLYINATVLPVGTVQATFVTLGDSINTKAITCSSCPASIGIGTPRFGSTGYGWHDTAHNVDIFLQGGSSSSSVNALFYVTGDTAKSLYNYNAFSCSFVQSNCRTSSIKVGGNLYFNYSDCNTGYELYKLSIPAPSGVGVVDLNPSPDMSIYPNPTTGILSIEGGNVPVIKVYNMMGIQIAEAVNDRQISIANQPAGLYFVLICKEGGEVLQRQKVLKID